MSWSFRAFGRPAAVKAALAREVQSYQAGTQSRKEFEAAQPALATIIDANAGPFAVIEMDASGSGTFDTDENLVAGQMTVHCTPRYMVPDEPPVV